METRIDVEVAELIKQLRLTDGKAVEPTLMINMCVLNVIVSIALGQRYPYGDQKLLKIRQYVRDWFHNAPFEINVCSVFRFVPSVRRRATCWASQIHDFLNFVDNEVVF